MLTINYYLKNTQKNEKPGNLKFTASGRLTSVGSSRDSSLI